MAKRNGLYFYEDWAAQMQAIPNKDFKKFILAMMDFFFYDAPPPTFSGNAAIIAGFIFPQLARTKEAIASGRLGGKRSAEMAKSRTESDFLPTDPIEGTPEGACPYPDEGACTDPATAPSTLKQKQKTKTKTNTNTSSKQKQAFAPEALAPFEDTAEPHDTGSEAAVDDDGAAHSPPCHSERSEESRREISVCRPSRSFASLEDDTKDGICSEAREAGARRSPSGNSSATPELGYSEEDDEAARGRWFEEFWETYPKKMGIDEAEAAFETAVLDRASFGRVMDGLSAWCASDEWQEQGGRFVPRAAVFLRDRRFLMPPTTRDRGDGGGKQSTADRAHGGERKRAQSFDIDDFFEAALRRSYGEDAVV